MKRPALLLPAAVFVLSALTGLAAHAQSTSFGRGAQDINEPVEITGDALSVDQKTGQAVWSGNVLIAQGAMRLAAQQVTIIYGTGGQNRISALKATGDVTLVSGEDAAEAAAADYNVESGNVILTGNVLLTQGSNVMAGERVEVNLATGTAHASGRVRSVLQPGGN